MGITVVGDVWFSCWEADTLCAGENASYLCPPYGFSLTIIALEIWNRPNGTDR